jgi:hypothetical protein
MVRGLRWMGYNPLVLPPMGGNNCFVSEKDFSPLRRKGWQDFLSFFFS